jgi:hypothetical protein
MLVRMGPIESLHCVCPENLQRECTWPGASKPENKVSHRCRTELVRQLLLPWDSEEISRTSVSVCARACVYFCIRLFCPGQWSGAGRWGGSLSADWGQYPWREGAGRMRKSMLGSRGRGLAALAAELSRTQTCSWHWSLISPSLLHNTSTFALLCALLSFSVLDFSHTTIQVICRSDPPDTKSLQWQNNGNYNGKYA